MKRTFLDKLIGKVSPQAELNRLRSRAKLELTLRAYDAAKTFNTDDWSSARPGSANTETKGAQTVLRNKGRDAVQNNPYAGRALTAIVSNTVGAGILPNIKGKNKLQTKRLNEAWKEWGETTLCDSSGQNNFYSMQALALRSTVESGEVLAIKEVNDLDGKFTHQIRLIESDHLVNSRDGVIQKDIDNIVQGIKLDTLGRRKSYFLYDNHPSEAKAQVQREWPADKICHVFRQDRPGQQRGVSWFHSVLRQLEDLKEFQQATLVSKKVEACFSAIITTNDQDSVLSSADLKAKREAESMLTPGSFKYLNPGEDVKFSNPSPTSGYDQYCNQVLRSICSGIGITYEAMTSDYSQVNFSSGRMGHIEFRRNVEMWRWGMLIPLFCEPGFKHFLQWCQLAKGIQVEGASCEWVPPAWSMIDPTKEIAAFTDSIRAGLTSYPKAVREQGYDPEELMLEIAESNKRLDDLDITLDSDPRKITKAGLLQMSPTNNTQSGEIQNDKADQEDPSNGSSSESN